MTANAIVNPLAGAKVAILGAGKMGGTLLQGFLKSKILHAGQIAATVAHEERAQQLRAQWKVDVSTDNLAAARDAGIILIGVKPHQVAPLIQRIAPVLAPDKLLISFAASATSSGIEAAAGMEIPVVRAMPNTPAMLGAGMTALAPGRFAQNRHVDLAVELFQAVGRTVVVDEKQMDAVTGLSGSGTAFVYIILDALAEAGVKVGLPRDIATLLAAQTTYGASRMVLETDNHPAQLKDAVTTPAGCTAEGILELEAGGLRATLIKAVMKATQRARELASK